MLGPRTSGDSCNAFASALRILADFEDSNQAFAVSFAFYVSLQVDALIHSRAIQ